MLNDDDDDDSISPPKSDDGGDVSPLSEYSSCGESEFERYCSANSAMGTPSLCSSIGTFNDCLDSDFGSFKSSFSLESFSLGGSRKVSNDDCVSQQQLRIGDQMRGKSSSLEKLYANDSALVARESKMVEDPASRLKCSEGNENSTAAGVVGYGNVVDRDDENDDGASSRGEHSEGEDSMYGTDDERKGDVYFRTGAKYGQHGKWQGENPLVMNSSTAFGSGDWDDFELETGGEALTNMSWRDVKEQKNDYLELDGSFANPASGSLTGTSSFRQTEQRNVAGNSAEAGKHVLAMDHSADTKASAFSGLDELSDEEEEERNTSQVSGQGLGSVKMAENITNSSKTAVSFPDGRGPETDARDNAVDRIKSLYDYSLDDMLELEQDPLAKDYFELSLNFEHMDRKHQSVDNGKFTSVNESQASENHDLGNSLAELDPLSDITETKHCSYSIAYPENIKADTCNDQRPSSSPSAYEGLVQGVLKNDPASADLFEEDSPTLERQNLELNDFYDEVVLEMEEILLDSSENPGSRFPQGSQMFQSQQAPPLRDGGSTASTSGTDNPYPLVSQPFRIDGVEVVGAKQKKGDVSLGERLVGVKEYTVYRIRVYSGKNQWEIERRYRDFYTLYRRLKSLYTDQGWVLPSPWASVEKESMKIFGNVSPDVVSERSALIQECLSSILQSRSHSSPPSALIWFLSPQDSCPTSPASDSPVSVSTFFTRGTDAENISNLGKTISLIVEIQPHKSMKQMLEAQHYTCAGCHKHFNDGMTLMRDFVQTLGWGKPRLCDYTGQLFCSSCHTNETGVIPARVLHHWDFNQYPVSQLAKSYLDSIYDQPMLCVSAVNPFLFSRVPALQHVMSIRKKIGTLLPYVRCPFRLSINRGLGSRKYLLESNDFFALRDLIDLSKGPFAALPVLVETVSRKVLEHITEQCLVCCDVGVACGARQACNDPSSLIFPFQEDEIEKCTSCSSVFHKVCFRNITSCPCGAHLRGEDNISHGALSLFGRKSASELSVGLLSGLFSKAKPENTKHTDSDNVILMGSLPGTAL